MRDESFLVAPAEIQSLLFVAQVEPFTGEFHTSRFAATQRTARMTEFWDRRRSMLEREAAQHGSAGAYHALIRLALKENRDGDALRYVEETSRAGLQSPAIQRARLQVACRTDPSGVEGLVAEGKLCGWLNDADPDLYIDLARAMLQTHDKVRARQFLARVQLHVSLGSERLATAAEVWWQCRQEGDAWLAADRALAADPDEIRAMNVLGSICVHRHEYDLARAWFSRALDRNRLFRPALLNDMILCRNYTGEMPNYGRLRDYVFAYPSDIRFAYRVAHLAYNAGEQPLLRAICDAANSRESVDDLTLQLSLVCLMGAEVGNERAPILARLSRFAESLSANTPRAAVDFGGRLLGCDGGAESSSVLNALAGRLTASEWASKALRAMASWSSDKKDEAVELARSALSSEPKEPALARLLAWFCIDTGDYAQASRIFSRIVDSDMSGLADWNNAIYADLMNRDLASAEGKAQRVGLRPAWDQYLSVSYHARATVGLLLMERGELAAGDREYLEAEQMAPRPARGRVAQKRKLELGRRLAEARELGEARERLVEAKAGPDESYRRDAARLLSALGLN